MTAEKVLDTTRFPHHGKATAARKAGRRLLVSAGVLSALMGAAHFVLPVIYPWGEHVAGLYEPVRWALFATTVFFGVLLVFGGSLTILAATAADVPFRFVAWVAGGMAAFWIVGAAYELVVPFPDPPAALALPLFSAVVAVLHVAGLWLYRAAPRTR